MNVSVAAFTPSTPVAVVRREGLGAIRNPDEPLYAQGERSSQSQGSKDVVHEWTSLADAIAGAELIQADALKPIAAVIQHGENDFALHKLVQERWDHGLFRKPTPVENSGTFAFGLEPLDGTPLRATVQHVIARSAADKYTQFTGPLEITAGQGVVALVGYDWTLTADGTITRRTHES